MYRKYKWYRDLKYWWFEKKLATVARFLRNHKLWVTINEELLDVWEGKTNA